MTDLSSHSTGSSWVRLPFLDPDAHVAARLTSIREGLPVRRPVFRRRDRT